MNPDFFAMDSVYFDKDVISKIPVESRKAEILSCISKTEQKLRESLYKPLCNETIYIVQSDDGRGLRFNNLEDAASGCLICLFTFRKSLIVVHIQIEYEDSVDKSSIPLYALKCELRDSLSVFIKDALAQNWSQDAIDTVIKESLNDTLNYLAQTLIERCKEYNS